MFNSAIAIALWLIFLLHFAIADQDTSSDSWENVCCLSKKNETCSFSDAQCHDPPPCCEKSIGIDVIYNSTTWNETG